MERSVLVAALYHFVRLDDVEALKPRLQSLCERGRVKGTLLLAEEGLNGTVAGPEAGVRSVLAFLQADARFDRMEVKTSWAEAPPFGKLKVRVKREIVTMGVPGLDPATERGAYVEPEDWNALLADPEVVVIDARNAYETAAGTFEGAIDPQTASFRDLPAWLNAQEALKGKPPVAMYCTGGIRCEKATAFLKAEGFERVYHLHGGILEYLARVPEAESRWQGECFVFDERVTVGHGVMPGTHTMCRACGGPVSPEETASPAYVEDVSCPRCAPAR